MTNADNTRRFAAMDEADRERSIETTRAHIRFEQSKLACKLVAHAAGLLTAAVPDAAVLVFDIMVDGEEGDTAQVRAALDAAGAWIQLFPESLQDPAIEPVEQALGEASTLGTYFPVAEAEGRYVGPYRQLVVADPLAGVLLPADAGS